MNPIHINPLTSLNFNIIFIKEIHHIQRRGKYKVEANITNLF